MSKYAPSFATLAVPAAFENQGHIEYVSSLKTRILFGLIMSNWFRRYIWQEWLLWTFINAIIGLLPIIVGLTFFRVKWEDHFSSAGFLFFSSGLVVPNAYDMWRSKIEKRSKIFPAIFFAAYAIAPAMLLLTVLVAYEDLLHPKPILLEWRQITLVISAIIYAAVCRIHTSKQNSR